MKIAREIACASVVLCLGCGPDEVRFDDDDDGDGGSGQSSQSSAQATGAGGTAANGTTGAGAGGAGTSGAGGGATTGATSGATSGAGGGGGFPVTPGVYATITATGMQGTHAMTGDVMCYGSPDFYTMSGGNGSQDYIDVHTGVEPQAGDMIVTPDHFVALFFNDVDSTYYPEQNGPGSCTMNVVEGWPSVRAHFTCTGLVGSSSGTAFDVTEGQVVCP